MAKPREPFMKRRTRIVLWIAVAALALWAVVMWLDSVHSSAAAGRSLGQAFAIAVGVVAAAAAAALLLGQRWRAWLYVGGAVLLLPFLLLGVSMISGLVSDLQDSRSTADRHSGRADFREQPALLAVANAIDRNDEAAIRAAAKNVPDLQAAGQEGKTLLYFAVDEALERPQLVQAVATLLSCGANPNYNNGQLNSFALLRASNDGTVSLLRTLLDAGGNPNGSDFRGNPIIFELLNGRYPKGDARERVRLLLDRGADVNSSLPQSAHFSPGYTLLLSLTWLGQFEPVGYTDALDLLERGADFKRSDRYGMTVVKMLAEQRRSFLAEGKPVPPEYEKLCDWLRRHGAILEEG